MELEISTETQDFLLIGEISIILHNRRARYFFEDVLNATVETERIIVPYEGDQQRLQKLKLIRETLVKYKIEYSDSLQIKTALHHYYEDLNNFQIFSEKAKGIWNNNINIKEFEDFKDSVKLNLPNRTLYPKQFLAAFHLAFAQNACNFSVPGAGKTSMVYAAFSYLKSLKKDNPKYINKILIVGPLSSFGPWEDEYTECFGIPPKSIRLSGGVSKENRKEHLLSIEHIDESPELTLLSYQSVSFNLNELKYYLQREGNKVMVVLDEAHKIKNVDGGIWAESVLELAKYSSARVVLTGTPIPNGYEDIYNLYQFIWPDKKIINFNVFQLRDMSLNRFDNRVEDLIDDISPFFIRIKKSDLNLPPAINHPPSVIPMGPVQREIYDFLENRYIGYFEENVSLNGATAELTKARFIRLMQAATNPDLLRQPLEDFFIEQGIKSNIFIDDRHLINKIINYNNLEAPPTKFKFLKNKVQEIIGKGEKVILWGTFIKNIKDLQAYLREGGIASELLIGETPIEREGLPANILSREEIIRNFHDLNSPFKVIIATPYAVAESISLHKACHHAIYFERTFNASNFIQSKDRIHRVGLNEDVITHYHYILSENSIDETIHRRLEEKEIRMLALLESKEIPLMAENLNFDIDLNNDVKAIIRDYVRRSSKT